MKIAVIVIHYGHLETTKHCLKELSKKIGNHRLILINNTKDDISVLTKIIPGTALINNARNRGFATSVNQGIQQALTDHTITHFFLLNNDVVIEFGSFAQLLLTYNRFPQAGIVTPVLRHQGGFDWGGKYSKWTGMVKHKNWDNKPKTTQIVAHVAAAAMLISRQVIEKVGTFDERFFLYFEDLDFCLRTSQAGFTLHINPDVVASHAISSSTTVSTRTKYQWSSHFKLVTKHLFKHTYPTAYIYDLLIYPIWYLRSLMYAK